eukprot:138681_1
MKLSRFAKVSISVMLLAQSAAEAKTPCKPFGEAKGGYASAKINDTKSTTAVTVTCPNNGFLLNSDGLLENPETFVCNEEEGWTWTAGEFTPSTTGLACCYTTSPTAHTALTVHWAADMAIGFAAGGVVVGLIVGFVMNM